MMEHPDETQLLGYVEEELPASERGLVAQHVGVCSECWARVQELETAREALHASTPLELPRERRERIFEVLREASARRTYVSPMRLVTVLAPVALVLVIVGAIASLDGGGDDVSGGGGGGAALEESGGDDAGGGATTSALEAHRVLVRRVAGPPARVAELLRRRGYDAIVEGNAVIVGDAPRVNQALNDQPGGNVRVYVESTAPPG
jgi:anti-sigma factor RsiW